MAVRGGRNKTSYRRTLCGTADFEVVVVSLLPETMSSADFMLLRYYIGAIQRESRDDCSLGQKGKSSKLERNLHRQRRKGWDEGGRVLLWEVMKV